MRYSIFISFLFLLLLFSCIFQTKDLLTEVLDSAGDNRAELEKVLNHYQEDSLKYRAACFLIEGLREKGAIETMDNYYQQIDSWYSSNLTLDSVHNNIKLLKKNILSSKKRIYPDIKYLSSSFIINHIDDTYNSWTANPWSKQISFSNFCEYILPYAIESEKRLLWVEYYRNKYSTDLFRFVANNPNSNMVEFCEYINSKLIENEKMILFQEGFYNYPSIMLDNIRSGTCSDYAYRTVFLMRALGFPICIDYAPQWGNYTKGHMWNVLITKDSFFPFLGFDETIKEWKIPSHFHCPKIYRIKYSLNNNRSFSKVQHPGFLNKRNLIDVSSMYFSVTDIKVNLEQIPSNTKYAYLCVFDNKKWIPVHWGKIEKREVVFTDMGRSNIYLPAYYINEKLELGEHPICIDSCGNYNTIQIVTKKKQTLKINRKYPPYRAIEHSRKMLGGKFQGANSPTFIDAEDLYTITDIPNTTFNNIDLPGNKRYKYVRYLGGKTGHTNIAELEFYTEDNKELIKLAGRIIGTSGYRYKPDRIKEAAFDGNPLTFFDAPQESGAWVGIELQVHQKINKIKFLPRNDDNNIRIGDLYELFFWGGNEWISLGRQVGNEEYLTFEECPIGALFLLHNHTRGIEERIFTYENGKQIWW